MADTTIKKVDSEHSPTGELGQKYLATGKQMGLRLWEREPPAESKPSTTRDYETVGFVIEGTAELHVEDQTVKLTAGDSWVVPAGTSHRYKILEPFTAVEATCPPAGIGTRDQPAS